MSKQHPNIVAVLLFFFQSAFSEALLPLGFDFHQMFVVDPLHDIERGVWNNIFVHLVCILTTQGLKSVTELNQQQVSFQIIS